MKLNLSMVDWKLVMEALKWGAMIGAVLGVIHFIKDSGRKEVELRTTKETVKILEQKNEVKDDVQRTINRVVIDHDYRKLVRDAYEGNPE